jgi:hypothetical protein
LITKYIGKEQMTNEFVLSATISIMYIIIRFIEMRFVSKEMKPLKGVIKDTILVYLSSVIGVYVIDQFVNTGTLRRKPSVFTGAATF